MLSVQFCSQAFTFLGNRRLLVTTVHLGACGKLAAHEHQNGLGGGSSLYEQSEKFHVNSTLKESELISDVSLVVSSFQVPSRPFSAHPDLSGLVDPPRHAQKTPHLLEGNRCVPAANGMGTVKAQQVQACWNGVNDLIWSASKQRKSIRQRANIRLQLSSTDREMHGVHRPLSDYLFVPLLPSLNVDVRCSGAPRTTEAAPTNPPGCSWLDP